MPKSKEYTQINNNKSKMLIKNEIKNIIESLKNTQTKTIKSKNGHIFPKDY